MANYEVIFAPRVANSLRALPKAQQRRLIRAIERLKEGRAPGNALNRALNLHLHRIGLDRIIYAIVNQGRRLVIVAHRRENYSN